jgi:predicted nuclease of restriction endonuclease-like (RecB) superfamily
VPQVVAQLTERDQDNLLHELFSIPWGHHRTIMDKVKGDSDKALFFVHKTIENGWSRAMLLNFIGTDLYERTGKAVHNFETALPSTDSDLARELLKDPYNFDFLTLSEDYKEKDLQKALEQHVAHFLIELGNGFAFVGRQVRLEVGGDEFYCDLLFYHLKLRRYVVIELKTKKFQPEYVSKLNFYCTAVDHLLKGPFDQDTVGLLICKEKNDLVAKWTVEKNQLQPIGISEYEIKEFLSKELPSEMD